MIAVHSIEEKENNSLYGPGKRAVLFTQGCKLKCPGCNNSHLWKREEGKLLYTREIVGNLKKPEIQGVTIHGGEPTEQAEGLLPVVRELKDAGKDIILFTGHEIEQLTTPAQRELLDYCDIVKCGPFIEKRLNRFLHFRGSDNQRIIINPKGALRDYTYKDGTHTVMVTLDRENGTMGINGMLDPEMEALLRDYAELNNALGAEQQR